MPHALLHLWGLLQCFWWCFIRWWCFIICCCLFLLCLTWWALILLALDGSGLDEMIVASLLFEQLGKVGFTVEDAIQSSIGWWSNGTAPMRTLEAGFVVGFSLYSHLIRHRWRWWSCNVDLNLDGKLAFRLSTTAGKEANLLQWIRCFMTSGTFVLGPTEHGRDFARGPRL